MVRLDMTPASPSNNATNGTLTDTIFMGYFSLFALGTRIFGSNFNYLLFDKLRSLLKRSVADKVTPFFLAILHVFLMGSKEQMGRFYTSRIVTLMANKQTFSNRAKVNLPRYTMSPKVLFNVGFQKTVPALVSGARPFPTARSFVYFLKKTHKSITYWRWRSSSSRHKTVATTSMGHVNGL